MHSLINPLPFRTFYNVYKLDFLVNLETPHSCVWQTEDIGTCTSEMNGPGFLQASPSPRGNKGGTEMSPKSPGPGSSLLPLSSWQGGSSWSGSAQLSAQRSQASVTCISRNAGTGSCHFFLLHRVLLLLGTQLRTCASRRKWIWGVQSSVPRRCHGSWALTWTQWRQYCRVSLYLMSPEDLTLLAKKALASECGGGEVKVGWLSKEKGEVRSILAPRPLEQGTCRQISYRQTLGRRGSGHSFP